MRIVTIIAATAICGSVFAQDLATALPVSGPMGEATITLGGVGAQEGPLTLFSNVVNDLGYYMPGAFIAEDLHMVSGGLVNGFKFGYYDPSGGTALSTIDVYFYQNDPIDSSMIGPIAAYTISGLPGDGAWEILVDLVGLEFAAPQDIWMALDFAASDSMESGWLLADPPTVGASDDLFYDMNLNGLYYFGGNPVANFHSEIAAAPEPGTFAAVGAGLLGLLAARLRRK